MEKTKAKHCSATKLLCLLTLSVICFVSIVLSGCGLEIRKAFNAGLTINRIIFTNDPTKYYATDAETYDWSDYGSNSMPKDVVLYKNGQGGADVVYMPSYYDSTSSNDSPHAPNLLSFSQWFTYERNATGFDGSRALYLNNMYTFSGMARLYPLGGKTTYIHECQNADCKNYGVGIEKDSSDTYNCEVCGEPMTCPYPDGTFHGDGTYSEAKYNWVTGKDAAIGTTGLKPLQFDELIVDGFDFDLPNFAIKNQQWIGQISDIEKNLDVDNYSYMFSDLPCKKITIKNIKGLQPTGAKYSSRDEYLNYAINNIVVKEEKYNALNNGTKYTLNSFVETYNSKITDDSQKTTNSKFLLDSLLLGYINCPITYDEYIEATYDMTTDNFVDAVNADPKEYSFSNKADGQTYSKQEVLNKIKTDLYPAGGEFYTALPVCTEQELIDYYNSKTRKVNMSHMFENCSLLEEVDFGNLFDGVTPSDLSYMFANCPNLKDVNLSKIDTQYVTDMSNMFSITASIADKPAGSGKYTSRDEQLLDTINTTIVPNYIPELKKADGSLYTSVDEVLEAFNNAQSDSDDKLTKEMLVIECNAIGIEIPVTYNDVTMIITGLSYKDFITAAINDPSSIGLGSKEDGTPYTEAEIQQMLLQEVSGAEDLNITKLYTDKEIEEMYAPEEEPDDQDKTPVKKLGTLVLGGSNSKFVIANGTNVENMFSGNTAFSSIVLPNQIASDVSIDLPFAYKTANGEICSSVDSASAGQSLSLYQKPKPTTPSTGVVVDVILPATSLILVLMGLMTVIYAGKQKKQY